MIPAAFALGAGLFLRGAPVELFHSGEAPVRFWRESAPFYRSRGHGRGSPSRRYGNPDGKYMPHQGPRECERRRVRGW